MRSASSDPICGCTSHRVDELHELGNLRSWQDDNSRCDRVGPNIAYRLNPVAPYRTFSEVKIMDREFCPMVTL